jgi:uncharacterized Zn finger protein
MDFETCNTCKSVFQAALQEDHRVQLHHQAFVDLIASKERGCTLCTWLWDKHRMQNGDAQQIDTEGFRVTSIRHEHEYSISFQVDVPRALDFTLEGQ